MEGVGRRDKERKNRRKREKEKKVKKTVSIKLQKSRDGSDCSFKIWKFNLILF
jgi:hypothetical protein